MGEIKGDTHQARTATALFFIDLDDFKLVNDSMGHTFGDLVLKEFAQRIEKVKPADALAVRYGGDEFIVLAHVEDRESALAMCTSLRNSLASPYLIEDYEMHVTASMGIALRQMAESTALDLLREADTALHAAKDVGKGVYLVFDDFMHGKASERFHILGDMHRAIEGGGNEFFLVFQPIVDLRSFDVAGFEALVRWNHPERGVVPPSEFIPVAEESGLISDIGTLVMAHACRQAAQWAQRRKDDGVFVSFNVSPKQLHLVDIVKQLGDTLTELHLAPSSIKVEVTETSIMDNIELSLNVLTRIKELGVILQIDDFGTGYSSLKYLQRIPAGNLKVDQAFVTGMEADPEKRAIVKTVKDLARSLGMGVVAEGVETREQLSILRGLGVEYGQGYLFDMPLPAEEAGRLRGYPEMGQARS